MLRKEATWPFSENWSSARGPGKPLGSCSGLEGLTCQAVGELVTAALLGSALTSLDGACSSLYSHQALDQRARVRLWRSGDGAGPTAGPSSCRTVCALPHASAVPCSP